MDAPTVETLFYSALYVRWCLESLDVLTRSEEVCRTDAVTFVQYSLFKSIHSPAIPLICTGSQLTYAEGEEHPGWAA